MKFFYKLVLFILMVLMSGVFVTKVFTANYCCVYSTQNTNECFIYANNNISTVDENVTYECNSYVEDKSDCKDSNYSGFKIKEVNGNFVCLDKIEKLVTNYLEGAFDSPIPKGTKDKNGNQLPACPKINGYNVIAIEHELAIQPVCTIGKQIVETELKQKYNNAWKDLANNVGIGLLGDIKQEVDSAANKACCIPTKPSSKTRCNAPYYTTEFKNLLSSFDPIKPILGFMPITGYEPPIASFKNNNVGNAYHFLTCGPSTDWDVVPYACNTSQKFSPPQWAGGGAGILFPLSSYCKIPSQEIYCACGDEFSGKCRPEGFEISKSGTPDKNCQDFIKGKAGMHCSKRIRQVACKESELICDYYSGIAKDCKCPGAGTNKITDECNFKGGVTPFPKTSVIPPAETVDIVSQAKRLNKLQDASVSLLIGRIIKTAMGIMGSIALAMFVYAGFVYMIGSTAVTGGATKQDVMKAKSILVWTSLGLFVIFASYALVDMVFEIFR